MNNEKILKIFQEDNKKNDFEMQDVIKIFSSNMKKRRLELNMTQEELSFKSSLHRNYISDTERGERNISLKSAAKIANALKIKIEDLFKEIKK